MSGRLGLTASRRAGLLTIGWLGLAGAVAGLVWLRFAPRAKIQIATDGSGYYVDPSPREYIHADLLYAGICLVVAVVAAVVVRRRVGAYPVAAVTGLAVGGMLAALIAWQVGKTFAPLDRAAAQQAKPGAIILDGLDLGAKGLLLVLPVAALATWLALDLITVRGQLLSPVDGDPDPNADQGESADSTDAHALSGPAEGGLSQDVQPQPPPPPSA